MAQSFSDVLVQVEQEVKEKYDNADRKQVMYDIEDIIAELNGTGVSGKIFQNYTADELSRMWGRLAVLQASMTPYKIECFRQIQIVDQYIKVKLAWTRSAVRSHLIEESKTKWEKPPTADDINAEVSRQIAKSNLILGFHKTEYEKIQSYWYSIPNILFRIEQRINVMEWNRNVTKFMKDADEAIIPEIWQQAVDYSTALED